MAKRPGSKTDDLVEDEPKIGAKKRRAQTTAGTLLPHDSSGIADKQPPVAGKKSYDVGHGIRFQSKLLMLFAIRAIIREYPSHLGTELPELGGKFDDLIFHVQEQDDNDKRKPWRFLYLQAKHRLYEEDGKNQITEKQLISEKDGDFSLPKYFRSYLEIRKRGNDAIKNCIICTNVGFANTFLNKAPNKLDNGIKLAELAKTEWEKEIFHFGEKQSCFKLKVADISKCRKWLKDSCTDEEMKGFFDKLLFVIKTPNERELDPILEREVGTILKLSNAVFPSAYILKELTNWFKDKKNTWLSPDEARRFFLEKTKVIMNSTNITSISIDNQDQFIKTLKFNDNAIRELTQKLELFWKNSTQKIQYITSETPNLSIVKITSALKMMPNFQNIDDFLVMLSNRIKDYIDKLIKALIVEKCHYIMVIIENHQNSTISYDNLIPKNGNKKIIVITNNQNFRKNKLAFEDTVIYEHLSDECKKCIQTKQIQFQGEIQTVSQLLNNTTDDLISKVMNSSAIQNLLQMNEDKKIEIPSFTTTSNYERSLYIKRQITYPFNEQFLGDLANKLNCTVQKLQGDCKIDSKGKIEWLTHIKQQKLKILESIKSVLKQKPSTPSTIISENDLMKDQNNAKIIITGVAGTGKSTFLSHYYENMKKLTPDYWIIKISLMNHSDSFYKLQVDEIDQTNAIEFFVNLPAVGVDQSSFSQSLLRHRLKMGERIVLMLDGFDEVDYKCQCIVIKLINALNKSIRLFVTTRSHMAVRLELELSQLAYSLVKFDRKDQINYLTSLWEKYLNQNYVVHKRKTIHQFASMLVDRVSETLNDQERDFIGIPLQCRILAECFQYKIEEVLKESTTSKRKTKSKEQLIPIFLRDHQNFDLAYLYKMLIDTKRHVFRKEKVKSDVTNERVLSESIDMTIRQIERHLRNLSITTIVTEPKHADILVLPLDYCKQSDKDNAYNEKSLNNFGISFGLLDKKMENEQKVQFLHRTYAEYFLADYIYNALLLDEESHNKLLDDKMFRNWFISDLFIEDKYEAVRVFLDSMLKETVDKQSQTLQHCGNLPNRLQQLSFSLNDQLSSKSAFCLTLKKRNANITMFMFNCFDATLIRTEIQQMIIESVEFAFNQRNDIFKRLLSYFNDADDNKFEKIVHQLYSNSFWRKEENLLNQVFHLKNINFFVEFTNQNRERFKNALANHEMKLDGIVGFFIINECCDSYSKTFFELLLFICSDGDIFVKLLKKGIDNYFKNKYWKSGRIQKTLSVLRHLKQNNVLTKVSVSSHQRA